MRLKLNAKKIKREMDRLEMKPVDLARKMKVSPPYIYFYLKPEANPSLKTVEKFAKALDLDPKDLLI